MFDDGDENEDKGQAAISADIESVLSDSLPSLTAGTTTSSSLTSGLIENIKSDVLTALTKDEGLRGLLKETSEKITHDRFQ